MAWLPVSSRLEGSSRLQTSKPAASDEIISPYVWSGGIESGSSPPAKMEIPANCSVSTAAVAIAAGPNRTIAAPRIRGLSRMAALHARAAPASAADMDVKPQDQGPHGR